MEIAKEDRADAIVRIQGYFREERGEELGDLAAGMLLDLFVAELGPLLYNQGVRDARALANRFTGQLDEELDALRMLRPASKARTARRT